MERRWRFRAYSTLNSHKKLCVASLGYPISGQERQGTFNVQLRCVRVKLCRRKAKSITYSESVCSLIYPACKAHAPYYIVSCGLSGLTIFFHIFSQTVWFSERKFLITKCMFRFSQQFVSEKFPILRSIQRDIIINVHRPSRKVPKFQSNLSFLNWF
jgi:hypothetical protein